MLHVLRVKFEADGTTHGIAIASSATLMVEELHSTPRRATTFRLVVPRSASAIDPAPARVRGVDEVRAEPYRIADLWLVANRVAAGLNNV